MGMQQTLRIIYVLALKVSLTSCALKTRGVRPRYCVSICMLFSHKTLVFPVVNRETSMCVCAC